MAGEPDAAPRTPLIAGNWKMYKTEAEAEEYIQALLPRVAAVSGVDVAICVPVHRPARDGRQRARLARRGLRAEHARRARGRLHRRDLRADARRARRARRRARPLRATPALRRDRPRARAEGARRARPPACAPILCVGETEDERAAGDTERKLRHQIREDLAGRARRAAREVAIAYEPIWAIGTGEIATPEQAQEAIAFIRALVGDRAPAAAEHVRVLYGGSVNPENAAELLALPDVDGALVGGASLRAESFAAIVDAATT